MTIAHGYPGLARPNDDKKPPTCVLSLTFGSMGAWEHGSTATCQSIPALERGVLVIVPAAPEHPLLPEKGRGSTPCATPLAAGSAATLSCLQHKCQSRVTNWAAHWPWAVRSQRGRSPTTCMPSADKLPASLYLAATARGQAPVSPHPSQGRTAICSTSTSAR